MCDCANNEKKIYNPFSLKEIGNFNPENKLLELNNGIYINRGKAIKPASINEFIELSIDQLNEQILQIKKSSFDSKYNEIKRNDSMTWLMWEDGVGCVGGVNGNTVWEYCWDMQ
jgi:hypothetical protein